MSENLWNARDVEGMNAYLERSEKGVYLIGLFQDPKTEYPIIELRMGDIRALLRALVKEVNE